LARGETQVGVWINMVRNPAILRLMKSAGLDFARFDMEHASPSMETLSNMALLARAMDFTLTVRPPQGNREWITRILDAGLNRRHVLRGCRTPANATRLWMRTSWKPGPQRVRDP
jgi:2-keto-3-deoxy-L-rhamnonate aldolase RhmA